MPKVFLVLLETSQKCYEIISHASTASALFLMPHTETPGKDWKKQSCCI